MPRPFPPDHILRRRLVVGARIREARLWRNLAQERLGERAGLDHKSISRIENGVMSPRLDHLLDIAEALDVPPASLLPGWPPAG